MINNLRIIIATAIYRLGDWVGGSNAAAAAQRLRGGGPTVPVDPA